MKHTCLTQIFLVSLFFFAFICGPSKKKEGIAIYVSKLFVQLRDQLSVLIWVLLTHVLVSSKMEESRLFQMNSETESHLPSLPGQMKRDQWVRQPRIKLTSTPRDQFTSLRDSLVDHSMIKKSKETLNGCPTTSSTREASPTSEHRFKVVRRRFSPPRKFLL